MLTCLKTQKDHGGVDSGKRESTVNDFMTLCHRGMVGTRLSGGEQLEPFGAGQQTYGPNPTRPVDA